MNISVNDFAQMVDHSYLPADATESGLVRICEEAKKYNFKSVAINSYPVAFCVKQLEGSNVLTGAAIAFPLGQMTIQGKVAEALDAALNGAEEFDYVLNVGKVKDHDWSYIQNEMKAMVEVARKNHMCVKVILETCYLTEEEIIEVCKIASVVKPDFVKTSTGRGPAGAKAEHVALMKKHAGPDVQVKAAGGIKTWADAKAMIEAGATRIGCSAGIAIIEEMKKLGIR